MQDVVIKKYGIARRQLWCPSVFWNVCFYPLVRSECGHASELDERLSSHEMMRLRNELK